MAKGRELPWVDPDRFGDIDDYMSEEDFTEDILRSSKSYRGIAYRPRTDDSALYDGEQFGYEGQVDLGIVDCGCVDDSVSAGGVMMDMTKAQKFAVDKIRSANEAISWQEPRVSHRGQVTMVARSGASNARFTATIAPDGRFGVTFRVYPWEPREVSLDRLAPM